MSKKKSVRRKHISTNDTHIMLRKGVFIYAFFVFVTFVLISLSAYTVHNMTVAYTNKSRLNQIERIYADLKLDDTYRLAKSDIFGDKRVYNWDKSRTYSSSAEYGRNDTTANTFANLKSKAEAAGFTQVGDVYGGVARQLYFKNANGVYLRISVNPKAWQDAIIYGTSSAEETGFVMNDIANAAPVYVIIRVNLDDNNE